MNQLTFADAKKLFSFLDSETPNSIKWIRDYLNKKGFSILEQCTDTHSIINSLIDQMLMSGAPLESAQLLANKMSGSWRVKKCRKKPTNKVTLTITIDRSVLDKLKNMSKYKSKSEVISAMIQGHYPALIEKQLELKRSKIKRTKEPVCPKIISNQSNMTKQSKVRSIDENTVDVIFDKKSASQIITNND